MSKKPYTAGPQNGPAFSADHLSKKFMSGEGQLITAIEDVSFEAEPGRITCVVGPTGCGKSTLLRIFSGLEETFSGGVTVNGLLPAQTKGSVGYLTQEHTLFPWMRTGENIGLPLEIRGAAKGVIDEKVSGICEMLGLREASVLYPHELSGGMRQRAALGRLLASETRFWLLDEPFSALDDRTRQEIQKVFLKLVSERNISALFVTHSIDEAVFIADRVVIFSAVPGRVLDSVDIELVHPRDRMSDMYGLCMEKIRRSIESVLFCD